MAHKLLFQLFMRNILNNDKALGFVCAILGLSLGYFIFDDSTDVRELEAKLARLSRLSQPSTPRVAAGPRGGTERRCLPRVEPSNGSTLSHEEKMLIEEIEARKQAGECFLDSEHPVGRKVRQEVMERALSERAQHDAIEYKQVFEQLGVEPQSGEQLVRHIGKINKAFMEAEMSLSQLLEARHKYAERLKSMLSEDDWRRYDYYEKSKPARREFMEFERYAKEQNRSSLNPTSEQTIARIMQEAQAYTTKAWDGPLESIPESGYGLEMVVGLLERDVKNITQTSNIQRGADLIKQLLAFCRGAEGKHTIIRLNQIVRRIGNLAQQTFPRNINVITELEEDLWAVKGDSTQIDQVLLNICLNARDAMPDGGYLSIKAENLQIDQPALDFDHDAEPGRYVRVVITDTGCGIRREIIDKIFEPFFTTKETGKGTGLGLSTALGIVRAHKGILRVRSQEENGSTFEVYFPAVLEAVRPNVSDTNTVRTAGRGQNILLVDDEAAILNLAQKILGMSGYQVITACDGSEAISLFVQNQGSIKLGITDILMPSMDGVTLMGLIRKIDPQIKLIASSGFKDGVGAEKLHQLDQLNVTFLEKPYTVDRLLGTVSKTLEGTP